MSNSFFSLPVRRPVLTTVIYIVVIVIGLFSLWRLPVDLMPEITYPTISVVTSYANAGPQEIEELITRPIESALAGIQGIEEIVATSSEGRSVVRTAFTWGTNLDEAMNDIRDRIDRTISRLPDDAERPMIRKFDLSAFPIVILGVASELDPAEVRQIIEDQVQYRLERVAGVASVDIRGGTLRQIQVALRADALTALALSPDMVVSALRQENRNIPAGSVQQGTKEILVRTFAEYGSIQDIREAVVAVRQGVPVTVGDIATVSQGLEEVSSLVRINGKPGIQLSVSKQSGVNTVAVARAVLEEIERINRDVAQIQIISLIDTSKFINQSITWMGIALCLGGMIAVIVLLLFLRNISSTIIIALTIPVSIIATFALIYFGGLTLNMMTFGGLALGIGMLLDNAIVVLDSIFHHREHGSTAVQSAVKGTAEVAAAVTASTLTTLVVFFPVVFIRGMSGIMFSQLAFVVAFSLTCSLVAALTLVPMLTSRFLHMPAPGKGRNTWFSGLLGRSEQWYQAIERYYGKMIQWALCHRKTVVLASALLFIGALLMIPLVGVVLMPSTDEAEVRINAEMDVGTRLEHVDSVVAYIEKVIAQQIPEAEYVLASIGGRGYRSSGGHTASLRVALVPKSKRSRSTAAIAQHLRARLTGIPGATIRVREGQGLFLLRMGSNQDQSIGVELRGHDLETGQRLAAKIADVVSDVDGVTDTRISREAGMPEYILRVDRKKAADLGLSASQIGTIIQTAMGGTRATSLRYSGKEYPIMVRVAEGQRKRIEQLMQLPIVSKSGAAIALHTVASVETGSGPVQIERRDRERIITVDVNYSGRNLGSVVENIRHALHTVSVPSEFVVLIRGEYEEQQKAFRELLVGLFLAILLVYLVMAGQFESFKDPFIVLFSIPMALVGVVAILYLTATPFSIQAFIGCIILAGIVVNNAIVLIDSINRLRREQGYELYQAIQTAGTRRLRPIMMTALTTVLGLLPLSLALGEGGESQAPMARVVIGGLMTATLITLILIPVIYSLVEERIFGKALAHKHDKPASAKMLMNTSVVFLLLSGMWGNIVPLKAQRGDTVQLSLEQTLTKTMQNNPLVRIDRIDINIAETYSKEHRYRFEPSVSASVTRTDNIGTADSLDAQYETAVQLSDFLPSGTTLQVKSAVGPAGRSSSSAHTANSTTHYRANSITIYQELLQNGPFAGHLVPLKKASLDLDIKQEELAGYAQRLLADTERAYWDLYLSECEMGIHRRSHELAQRLLYESEERLRVGKIAPIDLAVVKAEAASRQRNLIDAQTAYMKKKYTLFYLINDTAIAWDEPVTLLTAPSLSPQLDSLHLHLKAASLHRTDLRHARYLAQKGRLDIVQTRNGLLPRLDFFVSITGTSYAESFTDAVTGTSGNTVSLAAGLSLGLPVTNGAARQRYQRSLLSQHQIELSLKNLDRLVELEVRTAWIEVKRAKQQIRSAHSVRKLQEEKLFAEQEKLRIGKTTEYLLLQAQRDLIAAQLDEARAEVAYVNACTDLYLKDATLLQRRGIDPRSP